MHDSTEDLMNALAALSTPDVGPEREEQIRRRCHAALRRRRAASSRAPRQIQALPLAAAVALTLLASGYLLAIVERTVQVYAG